MIRCRSTTSRRTVGGASFASTNGAWRSDRCRPTRCVLLSLHRGARIVPACAVTERPLCAGGQPRRARLPDDPGFTRVIRPRTRGRVALRTMRRCPRSQDGSSPDAPGAEGGGCRGRVDPVAGGGGVRGVLATPRSVVDQRPDGVRRGRPARSDPKERTCSTSKGGSHVVLSFTELTLAALLFADATTVPLRRLKGDAGVPGRLLSVGLLLTLVLGAVVAMLVVPDLIVGRGGADRRGARPDGRRRSAWRS